MKLWSAWAGFLFLVCACSNSVDSGTTERLDSTSIKPAVTEPLDTSTTETSVKTADISPTIGTDETVNDFELTVTAPALVTSYSQFKVSVVSEEEIVDIQIVSDRFVVLSATGESVSVVSPIIQQNETIDYSVVVTTMEGRSKTVALQI